MLIKVPELDGYFVNAEGNIFSTRRYPTPKRLKCGKHKARGSKPYLRVKMAGSLRLAHRVVASAKIGRVLRSDEVVNHLDGDTTNNCLGNLQVTSHIENVRHAVARGLYCSGSDWYAARSEMLGTARTFND